MEIENINIHSLPSLLIPERFNLPEVGAVYFVLSQNGIIEYIGQTENLKKRWRKHECCIDLDNPASCRVAWFEVGAKVERINLENDFIKALKPKNNPIRKVTVKRKRKCMAVTGEELEKRRKDLGLSRDQLARELKTTYTTVYRWETQNRDIPPYLELAIRTIERDLGQKENE